MPIILSGETQSPLRPLDDYPTPFGRYIGAKFGEQFASNPSLMTIEASAVGDMNRGEPDTMLGAMSGGFPLPPTDQPEPVHLDALTARQRVKESGVHFDIPDEGMSEPALSALIDLQHERIAREQSINASPAGARSVAGFGVSLAAGMLDPLNIGAAFVPVVGPARYTSMLEGAAGAFGRAGIRAGVGAAEGAAGTALLEPLTADLHHQLGDDYTMADSLLNIAFGSTLGGGLHVGGGLVSDLIKRAPPEVRNEALKTAVGQLESGENINVEPIVRPEGSDLHSAARAQGSTPNIVGADVEGARAVGDIPIPPEADAVRVEAAQAGLPQESPRLTEARAQLDDAVARLSEARPRHPVSPEQGALMEAEGLAHRDAIANSEGMARAARAAALCMTGG